MSLKEGFLTKQGGFIKTWRKRWFVLTKKELVYYTEKNGSEKGRIEISGADVCLAPECKAQPAFKIITKGRTYFIVGETEKEVNEWVKAVAGALGKKVTNSGSRPELEKKRYSIDDFERLKTLGKGTYGKVSLVRYKVDGKIYAMKAMSKKILAEYDQINQILTERDVLMRNSHPFLVSAHFAFQTAEKLYMVLDYVPGGELFKRISEDGVFSESRVRLYAAEILLALSHLHNLGFIYRDLKPENILVDAGGHLKITDFGLSKKTKDTTTTFCGTPEYVAPEMLAGQPYTKDVDWWSFGTLIFEMLTGLPPFFDNNMQVMYRMILDEDVQFPEEISEEVKDLISRLLAKKAEERLGFKGDADEIRAHTFFRDVNWNDVLTKKTKPEWIPPLKSETDVQNFDPEFTEDQTQSIPDIGIAAEQQQQFVGFTCTQEISIPAGF